MCPVSRALRASVGEGRSSRDDSRLVALSLHSGCPGARHPFGAGLNPERHAQRVALGLGPKAAQQAGGRQGGGQAHELGGMRMILEAALTQPGVMNQAYRAFHNYSIGNQMLAALQVFGRGAPLAPIASFNAWRENGRFLKKGEKAISLLMPISVKGRSD